MVKSFPLTYLAKGGCHPPSSNFKYCLSDLLLVIDDGHTLGLPEYKLKVVNICKMHGTGGLEVVVLCTI